MGPSVSSAVGSQVRFDTILFNFFGSIHFDRRRSSDQRGCARSVVLEVIVEGCKQFERYERHERHEYILHRQNIVYIIINDILK